VNDLYTASAAADGWTFTSSGGEITKTITLAPNSANLAASYSLAGASDTLYVRFGLSPNLYDLLVSGQANLGALAVDPNLGLRLTNTTPSDTITANVGLNGASHVVAAVDDAPGTFDADTITMRNQAQTEQVEIVNTAQTFTVNFNLGTDATDDDGDGLMTNWEIANNLDPLDGTSNHGASGDPDGDGIPNIDEQGNGQNPNVANAAPVLTVGSLDGDYTTTKLYVDEIAGDSIPIVVTFSPGDAGTVTDVECVTNLNQRHRADADKNANGISDGQEWNQTDGIIGSAADDSYYYQGHAMAATATPGEYTVTLNAMKTGAYRLTARWKVSGDPNWRQYTIYGRRDHAVTVAPTDARNISLYEINTLSIEASGGGFAARSTFEDLHDAAGALRTGDGKGFNLDYLNALGVNWLWFQPVHPPAVVGRENDPATGQPYDHGSPYAIKNFFEIDPAMSVANTRAAAATAFKNFVAAADSKDVEIMLDAPFNHTGFDVELGQPGVDLFKPDGQTWAATDEIRNREARFFSRGDIFNQLANDYCQRASGAHNMTNAPDRGDFGKWGDVVDVFFGRYDALVCQNPSDNLAYLNEGDQFLYADSNWIANDFVQGGQNQNVSRNVWKYFRDYALHWLDQTGYPAGTLHNEVNRNIGIDGLRCDFGQGLPPQAWEYIINTARTRKWNFVMMSESLDGGEVTYRSNRHFDILNENIVFPLKNAANANDYRTIFEDRRTAYGQGLVLLNNTSHDEEIYVDPFEALIRYSVAGTVDGVPLIFMGQELGISRTFGFTFYETNFGKEIGNFKKYNSLQPIWSDTNFANDQLYEVYAGINAARKVSPALRSENRFFMDGEGANTQIHAVAKYEGNEIVLAFANLDRDNNQSDTFKITGGLKAVLGIDDNRTYNVKNIAAFEGQTAGRRDQFLWADDDADPANGIGLKGSTLESAGFFIGLKKVPTTNGEWTTAPFEAQFLKLIDVTPPSAPAIAAGGHYALGVSGTVTWNGDPAIDRYVISIGTAPGGTDLVDNVDLAGGTTSYNFTGQLGSIYYVTLTGYSGALFAESTSSVALLDPAGDADGDGNSSGDEDGMGGDPLDASDGPLMAVERLGDGYKITFVTIPGRRYTLLESTDLVNWTNVGDPDTLAFVATATATEFIDVTATGGRRFYRLLEEE
jgi:glycosidase